MICSFCATQLPNDAVYCAECGRPAMSRRARRSADAALKNPQSARSKRAEKKANASELSGARRRDASEAEAESAFGQEQIADTVDDSATVLHGQDVAGSAARHDSSSVSPGGDTWLRKPSAAEGDAWRRVEHPHYASEPAPQLGDPLVLGDTAHDEGTSAHSAGAVSNHDLESQVVADATNTPASIDEELPYDEDGPYDEVAHPEKLSFDSQLSLQPSPAEPAEVQETAVAAESAVAAETVEVTGQAAATQTGPVSWRNLPAPNPQEVSRPKSEVDSAVDESSDVAEASEGAADDGDSEKLESQTADGGVQDTVNIDSSGELKAGGEVQSESDDSPEPEPEPVPESESESESELQPEPEPELEPEPEHQPEPEREPEPLVEPSPLSYSSSDPDLSQIGRPDTVPAASASVPKPTSPEPVRPTEVEAALTLAERLRTSAFSPVTSMPEGEGSIPPKTTDARPDVASIRETASRVSEVFGTRLRDAESGHDRETGSSEPSVHDDGAENASAGSPSGESTTGLAATQLVCAQCDSPLAESDIFCGSCGFVRHGVGPISRDLSAPKAARSVPENSRERPAQSDSGAQAAGFRQFEDAAADPSARSTADDDPVRDTQGRKVANDDSLAASNAAQVEEFLSDDGGAPVEAAGIAKTENEDLDGQDRHVGFLSAVPRRVENDIQPAGDGPESTRGDAASGVPALSVLTPPPLSHHRVELPIAHPRTSAQLGSDDEDTEDTRIVERSSSGTRFVLQFSTGDSVIVTGTGLVGRNPMPEPSEEFDILVPITDPGKSVSKTHLEFGQMAGAFWISDRYSGNGTVVREPAGEPKRCEPGKRYRIMRGTRVEIGEQFFIVS